MDEVTREQLERSLAVFFSGSNQPDMSGDPRNRLSPLQRRRLSDAINAVWPIARAAALREAAGIARDAYKRAHRSGDENELEPDAIAAALLKEAETTEGK